jgi:hypothetical protein
MLSHTRLKGILAPLAFLLVATGARAALPDGPYVLKSGSGGWHALSVEITTDVARAQTRAVATGDTVRIPAVGSVPAFTVKLRGPAAVSPDSIRAARDAPLFVVADTHGEYEILVSMLRAHEVVDARLRWKFARGHLVVLGDVFDRGPNHLEILWLLYQLEAEAARAGGGVHLVLGNHETMVLGGDLRYLHAKYVETARLLGRASYSELFDRESLLGQWLRSRPAMLLVNDNLCLHAGVSRALVDSRLTIADINSTVRAVLDGDARQGAMAELVMGPSGPLWYRGYFTGQAGFVPATAQDVQLALSTFGARRMLVGHTIVPAVSPLYDGKVIAVQVYPEHDSGGQVIFASLLIRNEAFWQAGVDGSLRPIAATEIVRSSPARVR